MRVLRLNEQRQSDKRIFPYKEEQQLSRLLFLYVGLDHLNIPAGSKVTGGVKATTKTSNSDSDTGVSSLNKTSISNVNAYMRSTLL